MKELINIVQSDENILYYIEIRKNLWFCQVARWLYIRRRKERPVNSNITSRVDTCISSTRVSCILVQFPLYSPSFSNCSPLSIDTSHTTFHDTFVPLAMHTLTYVFRSFARNLLIYPARVNCSPKAVENLRFPRTVSSLLKSNYKDSKL